MARPSRGDAIANVVLYVPFGALCSLSLSARPAVLRMCVVVAIGGCLSFGVEILQQMETARVSSLVDVLLNISGAVAGVFMHLTVAVNGTRSAPFRAGPVSSAAVPVALVCAWVISRTVPFIPTIDWQKYRSAMSPLMESDAFFVVGALRHFVAWLVLGMALRGLIHDRPRYVVALLSLLGTVLIAQVVIVDRELRMTEVAGASGAVAVALLWRGGHTSRVYLAVAGLVACSIVTDGLRPFDFSGTPAPFGWIPFEASFGHNMEVNLVALIEKTFLCGALLWLLSLGRFPGLGAAMLVVLLFSLVEYAQQWLPGRTPEITDPLLVVVVASLLARFESSAKPAEAVARAAIKPTPECAPNEDG